MNHQTHAVNISNVSFEYAGAYTPDPFGDSVKDGARQPAPQLALSDITLEIPPGSCTLLVGPSGCGKSSLLRTMNGLIPHFHHGKLSGTVCVDGHDMAQVALHDAGRTSAMVFQNPRTQFFTPYVHTELAFTLENYGTEPHEIRHRVAEIAAQTGITPLLYRSVEELSGGELQRVACACALVSGVDLLLLDEPTSNLSAQAITDLTRLLHQVRDAGTTLVIAEHRLYPFVDLADSVVLMANGRITQRQTARSFYAMSESSRRAQGLRRLTPSHPALPPPPPDSDGGITIRDLSFSYSQQHLAPARALRSRRRQTSVPACDTILDLAHLHLPAGKVTIIWGPNGVGKTTLARLICGLISEPRHARIDFNGLTLRPQQRRARCAMVMQDVRRQLFTESVTTELDLARASRTGRTGRTGRTQQAHQHTAGASTSLSPHDQQKNSPLISLSEEEILSALDLTDVIDRHPLSLSGGQAQRLVVATSIVAERDVVIFDEPTSGVDCHHLDAIAELINNCAQSGRTCLVITHDAELTELTGDYLVDLGATPSDI